MTDPRVTVLRKGIGKPKLHQVCIPIAPLHRNPDPIGMLETQMVFGCGFNVYEVKEGWAWGQEVRANGQGYVGYVPLMALVLRRFAPTHCVSVLRAPVFTKPSLKSAIRMYQNLNAQVLVDGEEGDYLRVLDLGWMHKNHLMPIDEVNGGDFVEVAELHFGLPYIWGGISSDGLDCSGLVQTALRAVGGRCPA